MKLTKKNKNREKREEIIAGLLDTELGYWRRSWVAGDRARLLDTKLGCWGRSSATGDEARLLETGEWSLATGDEARLLETGEEKQDARSSPAPPVHQVQDLGRRFTKQEGGAAAAARPAPPVKRVGSEGKGSNPVRIVRYEIDFFGFDPFLEVRVTVHVVVLFIEHCSQNTVHTSRANN
ncbi:hypothetical protein SLEP1_g49419 [Rubroshorea leprosula]|uniref:Uncharacterized protein n=1 Tax=Rubroshorea leprosula TaxID=152421 RepID=A0AAV5LXP9_9ROSI|nr:hypothetical protein SLEP1_g49419 [Rubroshorea leprosula]